ncbi:hypothetical protein P153DRAFT_362602 [Dothidotthia symphoricarpi CBS 119687]|uniref:BRCT domain-containing protein n=1 Tax=Dothidotthia symphoricarpi CBS 119687 TaxID=1392245 RepID=A0A6A6AUM0_9PLEO|nr:uncharacterized protein P153DRAFT_362602 [Dothidotthia symphoricarpi CBS 119687]KAF2134878.1 hypothetical protein P153DRAFT_362602 [Dothidotthia symphoricarpi CBS 119687]
MVTTNAPASNHQTASRDPTPITAQTARKFFDPWNSSSTGHQRAENRLSGSTSWRTSRNLKLSEQHKGGLTGGRTRVTDTVGAGSQDFGKDGRRADGGWEKGAKGLRTNGQASLVEAWGASKANKKLSQVKESVTEARRIHTEESVQQDKEPSSTPHGDILDSASKPSDKHVFDGLCFHINGSTAPLVSDHKMKHILASHGARYSIALGRRSVTHVILGTANAHGGAGGGLAASKIQKEIARSGGKAVKFVTAEWVLECVKANRRLPESRFSPLKLATQTQNTVSGMFRANATATNQHGR